MEDFFNQHNSVKLSPAQYLLSLIPKENALFEVFNTGRIDIKLLRKVVRQGLEGMHDHVRFQCWKLLLGSLSQDVILWQRQIQKQTITYHITASRLKVGKSLLDDDQKTEIDQKLWEQITMDTYRTHNDIDFFKEKAKCSYFIVNGKQATHQELMARILYVWGLLNPSIRYVQGMNEMLAPIYYLSCKESACLQNQAQAFFAFNSILGEFINFFIKSMDNQKEGIHQTIQSFRGYCKAIIYKSWLKLKDQKIDFSIFAFRWVSLLLAQEFSLKNTLVIWDVLFSYQGAKRIRFLKLLCVSILAFREQMILEKDFSQFLPKLHRLKDLNVKSLVTLAISLQKNYKQQQINSILRKQEQEQKGAKQQGKKTAFFLRFVHEKTVYLRNKLF